MKTCIVLGMIIGTGYDPVITSHKASFATARALFWRYAVEEGTAYRLVGDCALAKASITQDDSTQ